MPETCWICKKEKGQPPERCPGHYEGFGGGTPDILETLKGMANFMYWPASRYVYRPAIAEIESLRRELTAMRSKLEAAEDMADLLKTLNRLGGLGLDKHQWIRESLARWDEARKASAPSQSVSSLDEARKTVMGEESGNA